MSNAASAEVLQKDGRTCVIYVVTSMPAKDGLNLKERDGVRILDYGDHIFESTLSAIWENHQPLVAIGDAIAEKIQHKYSERILVQPLNFLPLPPVG